MKKFLHVATHRITIIVVALLAITMLATLDYLRMKKVAIPHGIFVAGALLGIALVAAALVAAAATTDLLRDTYPIDFGLARKKKGKKLKRPYSLAQTQMAWWFFLILSAFAYLALTGGDSTITTQALTLMGIGTGTALGAATIEQTKTNPKLQTLQNLVQQAANAKLTLDDDDVNPFQQPLNDLARQLASSSFLADILTDVDGITLYRFQTLVWTLVLGGIFLAHVLASNKMPPFDPNQLALLGISGGAYLGFKIPEQPA